MWNAIKDIKPRAVCIEYNGKFPPNYEWKQAYDKNHVWDGSDWQGASLKAMERLGERKGYQLVGTGINGVNAFFVRKELLTDDFLPAHTSEELYNPFRKYLKFFPSGHQARYCLVGQKEDRGILNYYSSLKEYKKYVFRQKIANIKEYLLSLIAIAIFK